MATGNEVKNPQQVALSNQSITFEVFGDNEKLTIMEVTSRVNERLKNEGKLVLSEQSVRRSVHGLLKSGFIKQYGKQNNATLYGKLSASWVDSKGDEKLLNLAGSPFTIGEFLELVTDEQANPFPFTVKVRPENWPISTEFQRKLRKRFATVVMTSISPGYEDTVRSQFAFFQNHINELQYMIDVMQSFIDSPVWYAQYRDRIAGELRKLQEKQPELWKLAIDYMKDA